MTHFPSAATMTIGQTLKTLAAFPNNRSILPFNLAYTGGTWEVDIEVNSPAATFDIHTNDLDLVKALNHALARLRREATMAKIA